MAYGCSMGCYKIYHFSLMIEYANVSTLRFDIFCRGSCRKSFYYPVQWDGWVATVPWVIVYPPSMGFYKIYHLSTTLPSVLYVFFFFFNTQNTGTGSYMYQNRKNGQTKRILYSRVYFDNISLGTSSILYGITSLSNSVWHYSYTSATVHSTQLPGLRKQPKPIPIVSIFIYLWHN